MKAGNLNHLWGRLIIEELVRNGVSEFCLSPGSRSTPLAIAAAERDDIHATVHFDERGSAFRALGVAKATGRPAVLICTSGTAVANLYPAVIESSQSATPLIILSADRPVELRDCGASQTIDQVNMFGNYLRWSFDLLPPDESVTPELALTTLDQAFQRSIDTPAGPVQVNCQFREPLAPIGTEQDYTEYTESIRKWRAGRSPHMTYHFGQGPATHPVPAAIADLMRTARRGVIVAGTLAAHCDTTPIVALAGQLQWPLLADICSGTRFTGEKTSNICCHFDTYLRHPELLSRFSPDVVLQFGTAGISRSLMQFVAGASLGYVIVADRPDRIDPYHKASHQILADPTLFAQQLAGVSDVSGSEILADLTRCEEIAQSSLKELNSANSKEITELQVVSEVFRLNSAERGVFLATSMPIREADAVVRQSDVRLFVTANRGVNGIDGTIASAVGFSDGLALPVTLLIGDLAALHDLNSLTLLRESRYPIVMVVINNDGGGIFSMLPVASASRHFEEFFATPHGYDFRNAAEMFGLKYHSPLNLKDFATVYRHSLKAKKSAVIEVSCSREDNVRQHQTLWNTVKDKIERQF